MEDRILGTGGGSTKMKKVWKTGLDYLASGREARPHPLPLVEKVDRDGRKTRHLPALVQVE